MRPAIARYAPAMSLHIHHLADAIDAIAPARLAETWDNVGVLVGDPASALRGPVMLTIDLTTAVMAEAIDQSAGAIIAYHPPIFDPIRSISPAAPKGRILLRAAERGIAIISPHTALDATPGGVADWLIDLALTDEGTAGAGSSRTALTPHSTLAADSALKLITFVPIDPPDLIGRIIDALAAAGASRIGNYTHRTFRIPGTGTFIPQAGADPAIGEPGRPESVQEFRLETVVSRRALPDAILALRAAHPYEEVPIDILAHEPQPDPSIGPGRAATLPQPTTLDRLAARVRDALGVRSVRVGDAASGPIHRIGVCPGAGASLIDAAVRAGCQAFITGELRHHEVLGALDHGLSIILAGHTNTERGYLPRFAELLKKKLPTTDFRISKADRWPLTEL